MLSISLRLKCPETVITLVSLSLIGFFISKLFSADFSLKIKSKFSLEIVTHGQYCLKINYGATAYSRPYLQHGLSGSNFYLNRLRKSFYITYFMWKNRKVKRDPGGDQSGIANTAFQRYPLKIFKYRQHKTDRGIIIF